MYRLKIIILILVLPAILRAQQNTYRYDHYTGMLGKKTQVTADLCFENDTIISGYYYYNEFGIPILLQGSIKEGKTAIVFETNKDFEHTSEIKVTVQDDGSLRGTFRNLKTKKKYSFLLNRSGELGSMAMQAYKLQTRKFLYDSEKSPSCKINYCILLPGNTTNLLLADSISHSIYTVFFGYDFPGTPEQKLKLFSDSVLLSYTTSNSDTSGMGNVPFFLDWEFSNKMKVRSNTNYILSLEFSTYFYTGGAHGGYGSLFRNYNMKTGNTITLNDIFKNGNEAKLKTILNEKVRNTYEAAPDVKLTDIGFFADSVDITQNFYITNKGIGFFFNPYDVACYAMGTVDVFIPFNTVSTIMNEDFKQMISEQEQ